MKVSVVLPVHDDAKLGFLPRVLDRLERVPELELVCADSSNDGTSRLLQGRRAKILRLETRSRGARLQAGIEACSGGLILLHHPRSLVEPEGLRWLAAHAGELSWGGFTHAFDWDHPLLRLTSWYSNNVRARRGILYLDHCVFFRRELLTRPIPPVEIFEDTELSLILRRSGPPRLLPFASTTSAVRFRRNGPLRQFWLNQRLKLEYYRGRSDRAMNESYERGLGLNG